MSLLGGFAGGAALLAAAAARAPIGAWQALDSGALAAALAAAIARLGCLLAGCCHGRPTLFPIAIVYDDFASAARPIGVPLHATQVYESLLCATFFVATLLRRGAGAPPRAGLIGVLFVGTYCAGRFGLDFLRADAFVRVGPLSVVQWTCLALVAAAAVAWRWGRRSGDARQ
jgi:phosphatidylglycerol:prolipoprotein diacylglycerol transferase